MNVQQLKDEIMVKANLAARDFLDQHYGGEDHGACGFAWVTIYPEHKGNTKAGREERKIIRALGAELDWTGKAFQIWNPSRVGAQNIDCKEAGAQKAAEILRANGFTAYAGSSLD